MTTPNVPLRRATGWLCNCRNLGSRRFGRRYGSTWRKIVRENDVVLLKQLNDKSEPILSKPLRSDDSIKTDRGSIATNDILGSRRGVRELVRTSKGVEYRIYEPTLGEYTDLSHRIVTPIYSQDAALIVSLLDLHPSNPGADNDGGHDKLEIFEAGTGHGALTLHLARAIHAANTVSPRIPLIKEYYKTAEAEVKAKETQEAYDKWRATRRAVIHTLDDKAVFSTHARKVVRNFRQGIYYPNVDFHVGSVEDFLSQRMPISDESIPFLDHAILDLPNSDHYLESLAKALKTNGFLVTWCPSITQINKCVTQIKANKMPLWLEKVIEVGPSMNGGREWDVRFVRPRALSKVEVPEEVDEVLQSKIGSEAEESGLEEPTIRNEGLQMVCRPKVGLRTMGGGFIGLWRKVETQKIET